MRRQQGFTLIELAIVTVIMGLLMTMLIPVASSQLEQQRRKESISKIAGIDQALVAFVMTNRRLPCPADGTVPSGTLGAGLEVRDGNGDCGTQANGVIPWISLGLSEPDATDGHYSRFTYRVPPDGVIGLTRNGALDAANCDPAGGAAATTNPSNARSCSTVCDRTSAANRTATCTSPINILSGRGLRVIDEGGNSINDPSAASPTGAAYVLISPMAEGGGGYTSTGTIAAATVAAGTNEAFNSNGQAVLAPPAAYFHSNQVATGAGAGANHFDDLLSHPSVSQLMAKAQLAPRSQ